MIEAMGGAAVHWEELVAAAASVPTVGFWDWVGGTLSVSDVISGSGLALIVGLFATRKILTIADHRSRVADLERFHTAQLAEKDARFDEMRDSRNFWRDAHNEQRTRAEKAEDGVREFADEYAKLSNHLLGSIEQAAGGSS